MGAGKTPKQPKPGKPGSLYPNQPGGYPGAVGPTPGYYPTPGPNAYPMPPAQLPPGPLPLGPAPLSPIGGMYGPPPTFGMAPCQAMLPPAFGPTARPLMPGYAANPESRQRNNAQAQANAEQDDYSRFYQQQPNQQQVQKYRNH